MSDDYEYWDRHNEKLIELLRNIAKMLERISRQLDKKEKE